MKYVSIKICLVIVALLGGVAAASDLSDCPKNIEPNTCFGTNDYGGDTYVGELKDGKKHGQGTFTWADGGTKYVGAWQDNEMNGEGTYNTADAEYVGTMKNGTFTYMY